MTDLNKILGAGFSAFQKFQNDLNFGGGHEDRKAPLDLINNEDYITIRIEVPGISKGSINMNVFNNELTLEYIKQIPYNETDTIEIREIQYGTFSRTLILPVSVTNKDNIKTNLDQGLLTILIDKKAEKQNSFDLVV